MKWSLIWVRLPIVTRTALSSYEMYWYPWDDTKRDCWVRPMPQKEYVINLEHNPMTTYRYRMHQEDLAKQFGRWYRLCHDNKKTVCLLGIRADESLQRYSGFLNKKYGYKDACSLQSISSTSGVLLRCMTGLSTIYGMLMPYSVMIIISCMILSYGGESLTRPWHPLLTIIPRIP